MADLTVCCWYWIDPARRLQRTVQLTPDDVYLWDRMVARNLSVPHRRVVVTHRPDLFPGLETLPIDVSAHVPGTCCIKLATHKSGIVAKEGDRVLLMDIDCVVTGDLKPLASRDEPAVWWKNPNFEVGGRRGFIQGSLQYFVVGATEFLWRDFDPKTTPAWFNRRFGGAEQCWISERLNASYPEAGWDWDVPHWTENDGVYGAGRLMNGKMGNGVQSELPENARIVFTPGDRSPSQPEFRKNHPWVEEYWR